MDFSDPHVREQLWLLLFVVSELIGASKLRDNGVVQLLLHIVQAVKSTKRLR